MPCRFHLRDPFSLAIGNATLPPNIRNPAIDLKKRTARLSPAVQVQGGNAQRGGGRGAAADAIFQVKKLRALTGRNFCSRSLLRIAGALHDSPAECDDYSKLLRQALLIFWPIDTTCNLVPGRMLR